MMRSLSWALVTAITTSGCATKNLCGGFMTAAYGAKQSYFEKNSLHPINAEILKLAEAHKPNFWIHPDSWQPIDFDDYIKTAKIHQVDGSQTKPTTNVLESLRSLSYEQQCKTYLDGPEIPASDNPPLYLTAFVDKGPNDEDGWLYLKYNLVFDYSGMAKERNWLAELGRMVNGATEKKWHRFDIHTAVILGFDKARRLRVLTLTQHNCQKTYLAGVDFDAKRPIQIAAALNTNELYLDDGGQKVQKHRVVPFFDDWEFLILGESRPMLWAEDHVLGKNAGAKQVNFQVRPLDPAHPLADFSGLLAPPNRLLGFYVGRDGPPGMNYYSLPEYTPMPDFVAMGYWREGDKKLVSSLKPLLAGSLDTDWGKVVKIMRARLKAAL